MRQEKPEKKAPRQPGTRRGGGGKTGAGDGPAADARPEIEQRRRLDPAILAENLQKSGVIGAAPPGGAVSERGKAPSYYDLPMLKPSEWTWMVPVYFYTGGMAGASFVLSRVADRLGGEPLRPLARAAAWVAAGSFATCPPLLVLDLGDPRRFHHMLRVFKPISPMSVGSWTLTALSGPLGLNVLRTVFGADSTVMKLALAPGDLAGIPLGILMSGYTGILISTTSTPIWTQNPWIGPLFTSSAFEIAASAISLSLELSGESESPSSKALKPVKLASRLVAAATLTGYLVSAGPLARPLTRGKYAPHIWLGAYLGGLVLPTLLEKVAEGLKETPERARAVKIVSSVCALAGGFALKWAVGSAGHASGRDPEAARHSSRKRS